MFQGINDNSTVFALPSGRPVIDEIKTVLEEILPGHAEFLVFNLRECLDFNSIYFQNRSVLFFRITFGLALLCIHILRPFQHGQAEFFDEKRPG